MAPSSPSFGNCTLHSLTGFQRLCSIQMSLVPLKCSEASDRLNGSTKSNPQFTQNIRHDPNQWMGVFGPDGCSPVFVGVTLPWNGHKQTCSLQAHSFSNTHREIALPGRTFSEMCKFQEIKVSLRKWREDKVMKEQRAWCPPEWLLSSLTN